MCEWTSNGRGRGRRRRRRGRPRTRTRTCRQSERTGCDKSGFRGNRGKNAFKNDKISCRRHFETVIEGTQSLHLKHVEISENSGHNLLYVHLSRLILSVSIRRKEECAWRQNKGNVEDKINKLKRESSDRPDAPPGARPLMTLRPIGMTSLSSAVTGLSLTHDDDQIEWKALTSHSQSQSHYTQSAELKWNEMLGKFGNEFEMFVLIFSL